MLDNRAVTAMQRLHLHWRMVVAVTLCVVGLVAALVSVDRLGGRNTVTVARPQSAGAARAGGMDGARADEIADGVQEGVSAGASEASLPDADALAEDTGQILRAWLGGTGDDYLAYLAASGDEPPPAAVWADPSRRNKAWLDSTGPLRASSFYPDEVSIRASVVDGEPVPDEPTPREAEHLTDSVVDEEDELDEPARSRATGWRFDKLSGVDKAFLSDEQVKIARMNIYEVRVPMRSKGIINDTEFDGLLVLSYTRDQRTSRWTLIAVSICDIPNGEAARTPSF